MFENLVKQIAIDEIASDINNNCFPSAVLFSGVDASGKLTAALETSRVLACSAETKGLWQCTCKSCLQNKALTYSNMLLLGSKNCSLEISAAKETFCDAYSQSASYLTATRYLFLRSIRKLTLRFNSILMQGDNNLSKIGSLISDINDDLELLDFPRELPNVEDLVKICNSIEKNTQKLESDFMSDSITINQIRNMENWAHIKSETGKKTIIIENADRMLNSVRNALLKILEEPPADCVFILLTSKRNSIIPTILSRVRTYNFNERTIIDQNDVIKKVFHNKFYNGKINDYLLTYLPVMPSVIKENSKVFLSAIENNKIPDISLIMKNCNNFTQKIVFKIFLEYLISEQKKLMYTENGCVALKQALSSIATCYDNVSIYNQSALSALENLFRELTKINITNGNIYKCITM